MTALTDEYRNRFSVKFICQVLGEHTIGTFITSRSYQLAKNQRYQR